MKAKSRKIEPAQPDDDVWSWVVIGLMSGRRDTRSLRLIWQATHTS